MSKHTITLSNGTKLKINSDIYHEDEIGIGMEVNINCRTFELSLQFNEPNELENLATIFVSLAEKMSEAQIANNNKNKPLPTSLIKSLLR